MHIQKLLLFYINIMSIIKRIYNNKKKSKINRVLKIKTTLFTLTF